MSTTSFAEGGSAMSTTRTVTVASGDEVATSTSFFVLRRVEELAVAVRMRPVAPAWAKALTVGCGTNIAARSHHDDSEDEGQLLGREGEVCWRVLLSLMVKLMPIHTGAAILTA